MKSTWKPESSSYWNNCKGNGQVQKPAPNITQLHFRSIVSFVGASCARDPAVVFCVGASCARDPAVVFCVEASCARDP